MKSARDEILKKLRSANHEGPRSFKSDNSIYFEINKPLDVTFKNTLEKVNGIVFLCESENELIDLLKGEISGLEKHQITCLEPKLQNLLSKNDVEFNTEEKLHKDIEVGITDCEFLIAHTGSVMVSSAQKGARKLFIFPPKHIVIARKKQLVDYLDTAYSEIYKKYSRDLPSQISLITGPSRTADIEKTLILGAHGPKKLVVFVY